MITGITKAAEAVKNAGIGDIARLLRTRTKPVAPGPKFNLAVPAEAEAAQRMQQQQSAHLGTAASTPLSGTQFNLNNPAEMAAAQRIQQQQKLNPPARATARVIGKPVAPNQSALKRFTVSV